MRTVAVRPAAALKRPLPTAARPTRSVAVPEHATSQLTRSVTVLAAVETPRNVTFGAAGAGGASRLTGGVGVTGGVVSVGGGVGVGAGGSGVGAGGGDAPVPVRSSVCVDVGVVAGDRHRRAHVTHRGGREPHREGARLARVQHRRGGAGRRAREREGAVAGERHRGEAEVEVAGVRQRDRPVAAGAGLDRAERGRRRAQGRFRAGGVELADRSVAHSANQMLLPSGPAPIAPAAPLGNREVGDRPAGVMRPTAAWSR